MILFHVVEVLLFSEWKLACQDPWMTVTMFECPSQRTIFICPYTFKLCGRSLMFDPKVKLSNYLNRPSSVCQTVERMHRLSQAPPAPQQLHEVSLCPYHSILLLSILPLCFCPFLITYCPLSLEKSVGLHPLKAYCLRDVTSYWFFCQQWKWSKPLNGSLKACTQFKMLRICLTGSLIYV